MNRQHRPGFRGGTGAAAKGRLLRRGQIGHSELDVSRAYARLADAVTKLRDDLQGELLGRVPAHSSGQLSSM